MIVLGCRLCIGGPRGKQTRRECGLEGPIDGALARTRSIPVLPHVGGSLIVRPQASTPLPAILSRYASAGFAALADP